jgi:hypothetical protein
MTHLHDDKSHLRYARDLIDYFKLQISQNHVWLLSEMVKQYDVCD